MTECIFTTDDYDKANEMFVQASIQIKRERLKQGTLRLKRFIAGVITSIVLWCRINIGCLVPRRK